MLVEVLGSLTKRLVVPVEVSAAGVAAGRESLLYERRLWEQEAPCNSVCRREEVETAAMGLFVGEGGRGVATAMEAVEATVCYS
jgi:hypothetical protein